jgi:hypothetical protein
LNQLARQCQEEFDLLCVLLANSLVVHTDETGWSIRSVWAFLSEKVRVLFFGVQKPNGETLVVAGTNNEVERTLRSPAQARHTGRNYKTVAGARRQTVIVSVLESLRQHLSTFALSSVIEEIRR